MRTSQQAVYHFETNQQIMKSVSRQVSELESRKSMPLQHYIPKDSVAQNRQIERLQSEASRMAEGMPNDVFRRGFQHCIAMAINEYSNELRENGETNDSLNKDIKANELLREAPSNHQPPLPIAKRKQEKPYRSSEKRIINFFGSVKFYREMSRTQTDAEDGESLEKEEDTIKFNMTPAPWLIRLGMSFQIRFYLSSSTVGLTNGINTFRIIPDNSLIFEFCKTGRVDMVRLLFDRKEASPWDMNKKGQTLLDVCPP